MMTQRDSDSQTVPWYVAGLAFECIQCGKCCAGPEEGFVWVTDDEIAQLATFFNQPVDVFRRQYVRQIGERQSLIENRKTHDCVFLKDGSCSVYTARPVQCRTWPFWKSNIETPDDWAWAGRRCPGVNRGSLFEPDEIERRAGITRE